MSAKYLPLGIICVRLLVQIQSCCNVFIPTLAMSIEVIFFNF